MLQDEEDMLPSLAKQLQMQVRVCNSEDPPEAAERGLCVDHGEEKVVGGRKNTVKKRLSMTDETDRTSASSRRRALLAPASLPKEAPSRFSYASSRINRMRDTYSEVEENSEE